MIKNFVQFQTDFCNSTVTSLYSVGFFSRISGKIWRKDLASARTLMKMVALWPKFIISCSGKLHEGDGEIFNMP